MLVDTKRRSPVKVLFMSASEDRAVPNEFRPPFPVSGTALITGAGSGIGAAIAKALSEAGARVIAADINFTAVQAVASRLRDVEPVQLDVTSALEVEQLAASLDSVEILVNNAGIGFVGSIEATLEEDFDRVMHVNATSVFLVTKGLLGHLLRSRGTIINIASVAGVVGVKQRFAYCASKGAVVAMTRQLAVDYPQQLRVNCVCPGTIDSPFVDKFLSKYHQGEEEVTREQLKQRQPVGRLGTPTEVAALVRYLCSPEAAFMHGATINFDGGWTAA